MMSHVLGALYLSLPLVVSGVLHMAVVRMNSLKALNHPIDARRFGANKTWRGLLVIPLTTAVGVALTQALEATLGWEPLASYRPLHPMSAGLVLGVAYALAELPNSWLKRRLGIAPGKRPERHKLFFTILDQADSAIGCVIALALLLSVPAPTLAAVVCLGPAIHLAANVGLYAAGLRKEPL